MIPMEWLKRREREGFPFDVEEFFRRLKEGGVENARPINSTLAVLPFFTSHVVQSCESVVDLPFEVDT